MHPRVPRPLLKFAWMREWNACKRKRGYSKARATAIAKRLGLSIYKCRAYCHSWHLTHKRAAEGKP